MSDKLITTRLELVNYLRVSLNGYKRMVYTPDDRNALQIILGTNGSGKSSLMHELWPLPGDAYHYGQGGLKDHTIWYKNKEYRIVSKFDGSKKGVYEFWVDGENLNEGGKIEMCRALCMEHFGVNDEIRNLAMEYEELTNMGPARRRYWMVKLADSDFNYAIKVYNRLKEAHRDATGTVRRLQKRLIDETAKLADKNIAKEIGEEVKAIKALVAEIYGMRNAQSEKSEDILYKLTNTHESIQATCNVADRINVDVLSTYGYETRDCLLELIQEKKNEEQRLQSANQHIFSDHQRIQKKYDMLRRAGTESLTELVRKLEDLRDKIAFAKQTLVYMDIKAHGSAKEAAGTLESIMDRLIEDLNALPVNDDKRFSSAKAQDFVEKNKALATQHRELFRAYHQAKAEVEHRESHIVADELECPHCKHKWTTRASEDDIKRVKNKLAEMQVKLTELEKTMEDNTHYLEEFTSYDAMYRGIVMVMRGAYSLTPYFNLVTADNRMLTHPSLISIDLYSVKSDLEKWTEIETWEQEIVKVNEQIELKKNLDADTIEEIEKEMNRLEVDLSSSISKLRMVREDITHMSGVLSDVNRIDSMSENLLKLHQESKDYGKHYVYSRYQELLSYAIMGLQTQLARKEDALSAILNQQALVDDISYQIEETQLQERVAKAAHQALSPTNGAIAEGLRKFNNIFVNRMNKVIGSIWSYPLEIKPCEMDDGSVEMDYKFPFVKKHEHRVHKDVDEGSKSMIAIFNFAFRMCALRQLGLGHLPLFLDEFEASFDAAHRESAIYFVKKLLDENRYGQIYMVSHYESNHGALSSLAQTCLLDDKNVMLGTIPNINENVHFE